MQWEKKGIIYSPSGNLWWAKNYAHLPTAFLLNNSTIRIFFSCLDINKYGRIGYIDVEANNPKNIMHISENPVLDIGEIGSFEDCGAVPSCIIEKDENIWCYYHGFQRTERIPYMIFTGLASVNRETGLFNRRINTPILDRTSSEPFLRGAPYVLYKNGEFLMWYVSCLKWTETNNKLHYINVIRHARSTDGISWKVDEQVSLKPNLPDEYSVGRPCVVAHEGNYEMWFSARSHSQFYTIGYATSSDGITWIRDDKKAGITKSSIGWDSEIICYPNIIQTNKKMYMFYNGNSHGASGFGYAERKLM